MNIASHAKIIGTGIYVPAKLLTNHDIEQILGEPINDFVSNNIGIKQRYISREDETTASMSVAAGRSALEDAGVKPEEIDMLILATDTPDYLSPATTATIHYELGTKNAGFFDLNSACAGFVMALDVCFNFFAGNPNINTILVVGTYNMSKFIDWKDKKTCTIFADGSGAFVLQRQKPNGKSGGRLSSRYYSSSEFHDALGIYAGASKYPCSKQILEDGQNLHKVKFLKKFSPQLNIENWPRLINQCLQDSNITKEEITHYVFTQININATREVMKILGEPMEKTTTIMDLYGYTGSACIPMAFHIYKQKKGIKEGDNIIFCASGGGMSMCVLLYRH